MTGDNPTPTVTANRLHAGGDWWHAFTEQQREDVRAMIRVSSVDPNATLQVEFDVIDAPLLRFHVVQLDDDGRLQVSHDHDDGTLCADCEIVYDTVERPARLLPSWWEPEIGKVAE